MKEIPRDSAPPYSRLARAMTGEAEAAAAARVLCHETYLGMGQEVRRFEHDLAQFLQVEPWQVLSTHSGTGALHVAVSAVCPPGTEVLVPSLTYAASAQAITAAQCLPVFCDVHAHSATLDITDAATRISARTRAIMPMHYAGNPWQRQEIYAFAAKYHLRVIEDAAHAFGSLFQGSPLGAQGDMVCFSFDGIKNITCGEGGCIITFDKDVAKICREMRELGFQQDAQVPHERDVVRQGWRYHMSNVFAAVGRVQLQRLLTEFAPKRQKLVAHYMENLKNLQGNVAFLHTSNDAHIVPHMFVVRILGQRRDALRAALTQAHVATGIHYRPCHWQSFYKSSLTLPVTEKLYTELLTLPLHPALETEHVDIICSHIADFF